MPYFFLLNLIGFLFSNFKTQRIMKKLLLACILLSFTFTVNAQEELGTGLDFSQEKYDSIPMSVPLLTRSFTSLPSSYSLKPYCPTPGNQRTQGSCVGWASAYGARTISYAIKNNLKHMVMFLHLLQFQ